MSSNTHLILGPISRKVVPTRTSCWIILHILNVPRNGLHTRGWVLVQGMDTMMVDRRDIPCIILVLPINLLSRNRSWFDSNQGIDDNSRKWSGEAGRTNVLEDMVGEKTKVY